MIEEKALDVLLNYGVLGIVVLWFMVFVTKYMQRVNKAIENNTIIIKELKTLITTLIKGAKR